MVESVITTRTEKCNGKKNNPYAHTHKFSSSEKESSKLLGTSKKLKSFFPAPVVFVSA